MRITSKAFAASAWLLLSLVFVAVLSYLFLQNTTQRLETVVETAVAKQSMADRTADGIATAHLMLFRYVAWASNGVDPELLEETRQNFRDESIAIEERLRWLFRNGGLTPPELLQTTLLGTSWRAYANAAEEAMEVASIDPAMGTMMLGGSDDRFEKTWSDLQELGRLARDHTRGSLVDVRGDTDRAAWIIQLIGIVAVSMSALGIGLFARSIIGPIRAVTAAMQRVSVGDLQLDLGQGYRGRRDEIGEMVTAIGRYCRRASEDKALIERREQELRTQNSRFDAALANMSQGLCVFDADAKLVICNRRYAEMYRLPRDLTRPGTHFSAIIDHCTHHGTLTPEGVRDRTVLADSNESTVHAVDLQDGRAILLSHQPMPGGGWLSTHEDVTERKRAEARILFMATHDELTELPNRRLFNERLQSALTEVAPDAMAAVLCLDLDRFKSVNDTLGHPVGDSLLIEVAARLRVCAGEGDTVARFSGDEFAILQTGIADPAEAEALAKRIIAALTRPFPIDGHRVSVGASIGISMTGDGATRAEELLRNADLALYKGKMDGRGAYRVFDPQMDDRLKNRSKLEIDLRDALSAGQLSLSYQPIIDIERERAVTFEALLRWTHPEHGLVPPSEFILLAEETGLIGRIGAWVLNEACRMAAGWPEDVSVAVNLSPRQFTSDLVDTVVDALKDSGLSPRRLELEITESVLLHDHSTAFERLRDLQDLGVRIALDDFGTGYSALSYLRQFSFDKLKIDRCFIEDLPHDEGSMAILGAVTELASKLGIATTAEGVETAAQLRHVRDFGCTEAQGYFFSRPMPAGEVGAYQDKLKKRSAA